MGNDSDIHVWLNMLQQSGIRAAHQFMLTFA